VSIAEPPVRPVPPAAAAWRPLGRDLWVGRTDAGPVGTIERGRRYVATDGEGRRRGAYRSLDAAMAAFEAAAPEQTAPEQEPAPARSWDPLVLVTTLAGAASLLLAVYALLGI
jgi:hypothetical protein